MKLDHIGFPSITDDRAKNTSVIAPLQRCELITTDACNLKCVYCKGLDKKYSGTISTNEGISIIDGWISHNLKYASFSGGEPTLHKDISLFVKRLHNGNVDNISISTNGTLPIYYYQELIDNGVSHFAISIDGMSSTVMDKMVGNIPGTWKKVVNNITELSKRSFITASTVFTEDNIEQAPEIIKFIDGLGVGDIRFSSAVQFNKLIPKMQDIPRDILDRHPILKFRVANIIQGKNMRGNNTNKKCWLPIDDMVICKGKHFPCSMQLRENGIAIGDIYNENGIMKSMNEIRMERLAWAKSYDCQSDKICRDCCMDFVIEYNKKYDEYHP